MKPLVIALLAIIAVIGGVFVTLVAALTTVVYFVTRRWLGRGHAPASTPPRRPPAPERAPADAIEITATEVKSAEAPVHPIER